MTLLPQSTPQSTPPLVHSFLLASASRRLRPPPVSLPVPTFLAATSVSTTGQNDSYNFPSLFWIVTRVSSLGTFTPSNPPIPFSLSLQLACGRYFWSSLIIVPSLTHDANHKHHCIALLVTLFERLSLPSSETCFSKPTRKHAFLQNLLVLPLLSEAPVVPPPFTHRVPRYRKHP